ncbi:hypothetical protein ACFX2F_032540 [Malus domestica]
MQRQAQQQKVVPRHPRRGSISAACSRQQVNHLVHSPQQYHRAASRARETAFVASATKRMVRRAGRRSFKMIST